MLGNIVKIWHEELFAIDAENKNKIKSDFEIEYIPIDMSNYKDVEIIRGGIVHNF